jgi:hypothetical protein
LAESRREKIFRCRRAPALKSSLAVATMAIAWMRYQ